MVSEVAGSRDRASGVEASAQAGPPIGVIRLGRIMERSILIRTPESLCAPARRSVAPSSTGHRRSDRSRGFTLVEMIIAISIFGTLAVMAVPSYTNSLDRARIARAIGDLRTLEKEIMTFEIGEGKLPNGLGDIGRGNFLDPWNHPYEYLNFSGVKGKGGMRKDRFLVPLNSTYDLYSKGKDGLSKPPLNAKVSWDDVIRANDGAFIGLACLY